MDKANRASYEAGMADALAAGSTAVSGMLLQHYKQLGLSEMDVMLLIQLQYFREHDKKDFPTWEDLQERMTASSEQIVDSLQRMMKEGILLIDEEIDAVSGVQFERYNWSPISAKLAGVIQAQGTVSSSQAVNAASAKQGQGPSVRPSSMEASIFSAFEQELARPLSPLECETISVWLDQDKHPEELIRLALKEAVFAGKVHLKYIDRILLEWSKNRIATAQQAKEYAQRFRGGR